MFGAACLEKFFEKYLLKINKFRNFERACRAKIFEIIDVK